MMASAFLRGMTAASAFALFFAALPATRTSAATPSAPAARAGRAVAAGFRYDFGPGKVSEGYRQVLPDTLYTKERGYGFEPGSQVTCLDRGGDALRGDFCTSERPFHFSVALPEGNYDVTVTFGEREGESVTTVKAELRRLMLEEVRTVRGRVESRTFTVNVRTPRIPTGGEVKLKDRERKMEAWAWDEKLTLEFNNARPVVSAVEIRRTDDAPTLFLLGDSTVCDQPGEPYNSWGQMLPRFFRPGLAVANHAQSGESLRSSTSARRLDKVLSLMKPGDFLFIQFGHNDEKERGEGVGAFTTYKASLRRYVEEARGRGANVVLVTPVQRRTFDDAGKIKDSHGDYDDAVRQTATELGVPVGVINSSYGGSQAEAWTPVEYLLANEDLKPTVGRTKIWDEERPRVRAEYDAQIKRWREEADKARAAGARPSPSPPVPDALREYRVASSIYNGMIEPLVPFAVRGAFWYQGESNEARAQQYGILLPTMIRAWRERWGQRDLPFGIVQLPNYREPKAEPSDEPWSHVREAQRRTAVATKNAGLIVTIDVGEARDIHPKNKLDVGRRMARWALAEVYGRKLTLAGPMFSRVKVAGSKLVLTFDDVGAGLRSRDGDQLQEFAIAGADRKWRWAVARIVGKNKVEVSSGEVPRPVAARYAFNNNPRQPNLTNDSGVPAAPFRTDDWPGPTDGKR